MIHGVTRYKKTFRPETASAVSETKGYTFTLRGTTLLL